MRQLQQALLAVVAGAAVPALWDPSLRLNRGFGVVQSRYPKEGTEGVRMTYSCVVVEAEPRTLLDFTGSAPVTA